MIYNSDCVEWMQTQASDSIDYIITSPPYNKGIAYNSYNDRRTDYLDWMQSVFEQCCRILKPTGHLFLNCAGSPTEPFLAYELAQRVPWRVQNVRMR